MVEAEDGLAMRYENFSFMVTLEVHKSWTPTKGSDDRPTGWYPDFDASGELVGWDAIMRFLSLEGWEVVSVVPYSWVPAKKTGDVVNRYFVFAKRAVA